MNKIIINIALIPFLSGIFYKYLIWLGKMLDYSSKIKVNCPEYALTVNESAFYALPHGILCFGLFIFMCFLISDTIREYKIK